MRGAEGGDNGDCELMGSAGSGWDGVGDVWKT